MRKISFLLCPFFIVLNACAQNDLKLVAQNSRAAHIFKSGDAVKGKYIYSGNNKRFKGKIDSITQSALLLKSFNKKKQDRLVINVKDITGINLRFRKDRIILGSLAIALEAIGIIVLETGSNHNDLLAGTLILAGSIPYLLVQTGEISTSRKLGHRFSIVQKQ